MSLVAWFELISHHILGLTVEPFVSTKHLTTALVEDMVVAEAEVLEVMEDGEAMRKHQCPTVFSSSLLATQSLLLRCTHRLRTVGPILSLSLDTVCLLKVSSYNPSLEYRSWALTE